ncbi:MAG: ribose 1,5-bisphosphate isomerase [Candidatus Woesearchaeota archaeon]
MVFEAFFKTVEEIKQLKIQGAQNIAESGLIALRNAFLEAVSLGYSSEELKNKVFEMKTILESARPTEPLLRNVLNYVWSIIKDDEDLFLLKKDFELACQEIMNHFRESEEKIAEIGSNLIKNGMIVFTHCHSSTVVKLLKKAYDKGIRFEVYNTETRPLYQGRITAKELADYNIKVTHFVDSAARIALKNADLFLFGCDAITAQGKIVNKIGTEMFAEIAQLYGVEVYAVTDSWKFDPLTFFNPEKIEIRSPYEVWPDCPKNVEILNYAFEMVDKDLIDGIVCEFGIIGVDELIFELKEHYPFFFQMYAKKV